MNDMSPERSDEPPNPPLTPDQEEVADFLLEQCGLGEYAERTIEMEGMTGSVRYGLGRCAPHFIQEKPAVIKATVLAMLEEQEHARGAS